jgi:hypothetical protein
MNLRGNPEAILGQVQTRIRGNLEPRRDHAENRATETLQVPEIVGMAAGTRIADRPGDLLGWAMTE